MNTVFTRDHWDAEMQSTAERVKAETGLDVTYVLGPMHIRNSQGGTSRVAGVFTGQRIIVQADSLRASITQLANHEMYHAIADDEPGLNAQIEETIRSEYDEAAFEQVIRKYVVALRGVNDVPEDGTADEVDEALRAIKEEIFADAYAGINVFGAHAEQYGQSVRGVTSERRTGRTAEKTGGTRGPPERYSVETLPDGKQFVKADRMVLFGSDPREWRVQLEDYINGKIRNGEDVTLIGADGDELVLTATSAGKLSSPYTNDGRTMSDESYERKANAAAHIDELVSISNRKGAVKTDRAGRHGEMASDGWAYRTAYFEDFDGKYYQLTISAARNASGSMVYNIGNMKEEASPKVKGSSAGNGNGPRGFASSKNSIRSPEQKSQEKFSVLESGTEQEDTRRSERINAPTIAAQELRKTLMDMFSVEKAQQTDAGRIIDYFADRIYRNGELTQVDRDVLFARLYDSGAMTESLSEYPGAAPDIVGDGRVYVSDSTRRAFGAEWSDFRKRAFSAGIYLTGDTGDRTPGAWMDALAETAPDTFQPEGGSQRQALEQIVQAAEEAQDQRMSLSEYAMTLAGKDFTPEDEILEGMERQMDWALQTFAEKAKLEVRLRDARDAAVKQERAKAAEKAARAAQRRSGSVDAMEARIDEKLQKKDAAAAKSREKLVEAMEARTDERIRKKEAALAKSKEKLIDAMEARIDEKLRREKAREADRRALERQDRRDMAARQKARRELSQLQQKTLKTLQWLNKNRYRAPEELRERFDEVLSDIDVYAVGAANELQWSDKYGATWRDLAQMYQDAKANDPNFLPSKELERIVARLDNRKIEDMDLDALNDLYKTAVDLRTEFYNRNRVLGDLEDRMFEEVYADSTRELRSAGGRKQVEAGLADKYFNDLQLTPMNRLERMAGWNPRSTWYGMAQQLEEGERAQRRFEEHAQRQVGTWLKAHQEWAKRSDGQGKDAIWYEINVPQLAELGMGDKPVFGEEVTVWMTPAQKVHLYLESRNYDNLRHMVGGRTFPDKELYSKGKRKEAFAQGRTIKLAPETVKAIVSDLTPEERELADVLDAFYNGYAKGEINRVSNILYGYDKAMGRNYAPIFTNSSFTKSEPGVYDVTAESIGNLKTRQVSKNPSYNISAYDAFERNVRQTARFVGMAVPARNWKTLMNWRGGTSSMRDTVEKSWGERANTFIDDLITELEAGKDREKTFGGKLLSQYIGGVFGANPGIVLKQAASFPLAAAYLNPKYMPNIAKALRVDDALIGAYTSELGYRLMGYATPATAQIKENPGKLQEQGGVWHFVFGGGAITAMDGWTVKSLWTWAANQVRAEQPQLALGTPEQVRKGESAYYKEVAKLFEYAVSRSQPMYDVMHRSAVMKWSWAKPVTLFKTVPLQEYNMLRQTAGEAQWARQNGTEEEQKQANRRAGRAVLGILTGNLMLGAITFIGDMVKYKGKHYRDEDGNLTWASFLKQFGQQYLVDSLGIMVGGDLPAEGIGAVFADGKFYGLTAPGVEQVNEVVNLIVDSTRAVKQLVADSIEVVQDGGDWKQYMRDHSETYLQAIRTLAKQLATYIGAFPAQNLEARLLGTVRWISPELAAAYEDVFEKADKSGLKGLTGGALEQRIGSILSDKLGERDEESIKALAALYTAGFQNAIPGSVPDDVTVNSESRTLGLVQQQTYENVWSDTAKDTLKELVRSTYFQNAGDEQQAKMLAKLYEYADSMAKSVLFDDYEPEAWAQRLKAFAGSGGAVPDALAVLIYNSEAVGEKDLNGATISGSKRRKVMAYIDRVGASDAEKKQLVSVAGYDEAGTEPWNGMDYEGIEEAVRTGFYQKQNMRQFFSTLMKEGVEKKNLSDAITQLFKDEYLRAAKQEKTALKGRLINAFMCLGYTQKESTSRIDKWDENQQEKEAAK